MDARGFRASNRFDNEEEPACQLVFDGSQDHAPRAWIFTHSQAQDRDQDDRPFRDEIEAPHP
jgi:hypothetical protein